MYIDLKVFVNTIYIDLTVNISFLQAFWQWRPYIDKYYLFF